MAAAYDYEEAEPESEPVDPNARLRDILSHEGNLAEALEADVVAKLGADTIREAELDDAGRKDWRETAARALKNAAQEKGDKNYPWPNAANIKFPLLTTSAIQFAARAYPSLVRGDQVVLAKVQGRDDNGEKARRAQRTSDFVNDQLMYQCDEWEPGTDALLHALPIVGAGFRKVRWDRALKRPRLELASAMDIILPADAHCADDAPRLTQRLEVFPFMVAQKVRSGIWTQHECGSTTDDAQKPCVYYEQMRFEDMDDDGLPEPYVVTVHKDTQTVVCVEPAFDGRDIRVSQQSGVEAIERQNPWIDYTFLPDPKGGPYGIGFGHLLEALSETINAALNQMIDAGHLANAPGGFISGGLGLRSGTMRLVPNEYKVIPVGADQVRNAIYTHDFRGPSPVLFQLVDMLLGAAKDITAVKDVLTGEAPSQQPATSTLALIEQGLSVFTAIYKRIYRSMRREYRAVYRLNARYLPPEVYQRFIDWRPPEPEQQPQGMPAPGAMPMQPLQPGMAPMGQPMAMQEPPTPEKDFDLTDMDVRPTADPSTATDLQRMARAQFLAQVSAGDPSMDQIEVKKRMLTAARVEDIDKLFVKGTPMPVMLAMKEKEAEQQQKERELAVKETQADASQKNEEEKRQLDKERLDFERKRHDDDMAMRERELEQRREDAEAKRQDDAQNRERDRMAKLASDDATTNAKRDQEERRRQDDESAKAEKAEREREKQVSSEQTGAIGKGLEALAGAIVAQSEAQRAMADSLARPKRLVRGPDGRAEGIE